MKKKGQTNMLLAVLIAVIIGVVMLGVVFTMVENRTSIFNQKQNLINYTNLDTALLLTKPDGFSVVSGSPEYIKNTTTSLTTVCNITTTSNNPYLTCSVSGNVTDGLINVSYYYTKDGYYTGSTTRTIGNIIPILLAVGLISVIVLIYGIGKKQ